jgi:hypothetical protein
VSGLSFPLNVIQSVAESSPTDTTPLLVGIKSVSVLVVLSYDKNAVCPAIVMDDKIVLPFIVSAEIFCRPEMLNPCTSTKLFMLIAILY